MPSLPIAARRYKADVLLTHASRWAPGILVGAAALAAFTPILSNGFVGYDDQLYLQDNPLILGLVPSHIRAMLTAARGGLWQPLTWLSFAISRLQPEPASSQSTSVSPADALDGGGAPADLP